jgi:hypothetical protein
MVRSLDMHGHWINSIALSSDHVMRNSPPTESEAKLTPAQRYAKATGGEEERMVSCSDDHTLCLWLPCSSKKPVARMTGHMQPVNHVAFSPDGSMIASASFDKSVKIWDGRTGSRAFSIALGASCSAFTRVPVNRHRVPAQQLAAPAQFSDTLPPPPPPPMPHQESFWAVALVTSVPFIKWRGPATAACSCPLRKTARSRFGMRRREN